jgi:hypothetical protein
MTIFCRTYPQSLVANPSAAAEYVLRRRGSRQSSKFCRSTPASSRNAPPITWGTALALPHRFRQLWCPLILRYPYNLDFDYEALEGLNKFSINNLGDPFIESNYGVHSREFEVSTSTGCFPWWCSQHIACRQVGVLNWFARLWDIDEDEYWGYITNCGTEGNLHGILVGRENLPDGECIAAGCGAVWTMWFTVARL